ncbi:MAG: hypothetical protein ACFFG0_00835 [Candidatus Thorarchaeota archaeon]
MGMDLRILDEEEMESTYSYSNESDMQRQEKFLDIELEKRKWKNRRKMAWTSLISMNIITLILLFAPISDARLKVIAEPLTWSYLAFTSVIGAYMGFTTWASRR